MNVQLEEELAYRPQSEAQMCFREAEAACYDRSAEATISGSGPVWVECHHSYYCKATDAFAGTYLESITHVADYEAAEALVNELHALGDDEADYRIMPVRKVVYTPEVSDASDDSYCPF